MKHFFPTQPGHGVRSPEDPAFIEFLKSKNIYPAICPASNVQTNVVDVIGNHAADKIRI